MWRNEIRRYGRFRLYAVVPVKLDAREFHEPARPGTGKPEQIRVEHHGPFLVLIVQVGLIQLDDLCLVHHVPVRTGHLRGQ
jgi:hypothetical protein